MKKVFITIVLLMTAGMAFSQFTFGPKVNLNFTKSPKITLNSSVSSIAQDLKSSMQPGVDVGVFFRIGKKLYFQPEVMYSYKTVEFSEYDHAGDLTAKSDFAYHTIDVPLMIGYSFLNTQLFKMRAFVGPNFSFKLANNKINWDDIQNPENIKFSDYYINIDLGLGVDIWKFMVDIKWEFACNPGIKLENANKNIYFNMLKIGLAFKIL